MVLHQPLWLFSINQFSNHHLQMILHKVRFQPFRSFLLKNELFVSDIYKFCKCLKRLFHRLNIFPPFLILSSCPQIWKRFCRYAGSTMNILCMCSQILTRSKWNWCREQKCLFQNNIRNKDCEWIIQNCTQIGLMFLRWKWWQAPVGKMFILKRKKK